MIHQYAGYLPSDFDNFDCLKVSKGIYLLLFFILRGYVVWIMSVTNMNDRVGIIKWIYPEPSLFYLSLFSGLFGIFVLLILSLRRPDASKWVEYCWANIRGILVFAMVFDLAVNLLGLIIWQQHSLSWLCVNLTLVAAFSLFLFRSKRIKINISEFPEKLPDK